MLVLLSVLLPSDCPGATRLTLEVTRLCSLGVMDACGDSRLTFPEFPELVPVLPVFPESVPGAWVLTSALSDVLWLVDELLPEGLPPTTPGP